VSFETRGARTLADLERLAVENHPTLAQAAATIEAARGRQWQAGRKPNPTIGYAGSEIGNDGRAGQQGVAMGQEIVRGGKLRLASVVASHEVEQAESEAAAQSIRILNAVRSAFYETLAAERTLALTRELMALAEKGVSIAEIRMKPGIGEGTIPELLQAQIELDQARILEAAATNNHRAAWRRLAAAIGQPALEWAPLAGSLDAPRDERDESWLETITAGSPELQFAEASVRRARAAVARARAEPTPNVTIEAGAQYDHASRTTIANAGLSFPIPIRNRNQGNIVAAESELRRAEHEVDRVKLSLAERFAAALARYQNARQQVERFGARLTPQELDRILGLVGDERHAAVAAHPHILPRAQLAMAFASEGWQRGQFSYLQVLTAQRTLTQVSLNQVRALAELQQALVTLNGYLLGDAARPDDALPSAATSLRSGD
jgi:cobalt-zinc-cadmium efflux system outer membrane protein